MAKAKDYYAIGYDISTDEIVRTKRPAQEVQLSSIRVCTYFRGHDAACR